MRQQARTLYEQDQWGRLHRIPDLTAPENEWEGAPRLFMGRTVEGNVWHFRHDLSVALVNELDALCRREPPLSAGESQLAPAIRALLGNSEEWRGPAYLIPPQRETGQAVEITSATAEYLLPHFPGTAQRSWQGHCGPITAVVKDGQAVAVCSCVRQSSAAAEAGVFTLEQHRGHGYAAQVTALWANLVYQRKILPFYSTSWENTASQGVASKLNAQLFGEDWSIR